MKDLLAELVNQAILDLKREGDWPDTVNPQIVIERTRDKQHGDFACNVAMRAAKPLQRDPMAIAQAIVDHVLASKKIDHVAVAKPGFINFTLSASARLTSVRQVLKDRERFGQGEALDESIGVEFVSANPTGPLHVGHGRGAAYGASLAALLAKAGHQVQREYYVNDHGRQMQILAFSVWLRYLELSGDRVEFPANAYQGDYIYDIARTVRAEQGDQLRAAQPKTDIEDPDAAIDAQIGAVKLTLGEAQFDRFLQAALDAILGDIRDDLSGFGVEFDAWYSERSLHTQAFVSRAIDKLRTQGHLFERDGATWFRASAMGDEKDRVVVRENGVPTYFASDLGYLLAKFERFDRAIYVLGSDHHGYIARLKAAAQGLGFDPARVEVQLVQFAVLYEGGEKMQMSTRSGKFVTLRDLRELTGRDAARFFYVMRSHKEHLDFDLDLARSQSNENPVYYVQYAHARIESILSDAGEGEQRFAVDTKAVKAELLTSDHELELADQLGMYPETIQQAAANRTPHTVAHYLTALAQTFHAYYNATRVLVDDDALRAARLSLLAATQVVIADGLSILGVSAPARMVRDEDG